MKIDKIVTGGGGKTLSFLLAAAIAAISAAQSYTALADEYLWNGGSSGVGWTAAGSWLNNGSPAGWADSGAAVFAAAGDSATVDSAVSAASLTFRADATVSGSAALTAPVITVSNGVSATVSAPTAGVLEKKGPGTLTLGSSRTAANTTLTDGTLVMSGSGATLDWSKFTFGTDTSLPVTLHLANGANIASVPSPMYVGNVAGMTSTLIKDSGSWNISGNFALGTAAGVVSSFYHNGGTLTAGNYLSIGDAAGEVYFEIAGGTVRSTKNAAARAIIGSAAGVSAEVVVKNSATFSVTKELAVGNNNGSRGVLTIEDNARVTVGTEVIFDYSSAGASGTINLNGGTLEMQKAWIKQAGGSAAISFNGGTLKAKLNNANLIDSNVAVNVGANGGTIDNGGKSISIGVNIAGTGALALTGTGTTKFAASQTGGLDISVAEGTTLAVGSGATLSFDEVSFSAGSSLDIASSQVSGVPLTADSLTLPASGTISLTLGGGTFADGIYRILSRSGISVEDVQNRLVPSIREGGSYEWSVVNDILILNVGNLSGNVWTGLAGDGKMSSNDNWLDRTAPVAGESIDFTAVASAMAIDADVDGNPLFASAAMGSGVITFTGTLSVGAVTNATGAIATDKIAVGANSTVTFDGDLVFTGGTCYITRKVDEGGAFVVTGDIRASDSADVRPYSETSSGWIVAKGLENAETTGDAWYFRLNDGKVAKWVVGEDGISGTQYFWSFNSAAADTTIKADADFTIATWLNAGNAANGNGVTLDTSGWTDSAVNHMITANCGFVGNKPLTVKGGGKFLCNFTPAVVSVVAAFSGEVTVSDTATLAINAGKYPTTGAITVGGNATLSLPQTGTVMLGGDLALEADAALEFSPSGVTDSTLAIASGKTLSLPESGTVTVKFASKALVKPGQSYTLLAGAGLADASKSKFALESGDGGTLSVSGSDLVYTAPRYFMIRIADGGAEESIPVAWDWIVENGYGTLADTEAVVSTAIAESAANGLPAWQCYCLGLDPEDAASRIYCAKSADQTGVEAGSVRVAAANLNVPENPELAVSASLERSADLVNWEIADGPDEVPSGSVEFIATISENASVSYFRISAHIAAASGS